MGRLCVAMVSDFFYPHVGGVENHIYELAQSLILRGVKVVVITHHYIDDKSNKKKKGIRWLKNGLKVYYIPHMLMITKKNSLINGILPNGFGPVALFRNILIREQVTIFHGHSSYSAMKLELARVAYYMGIPVVMTEHSMGSDSFGSKMINYLLNWSLVGIDRVITVSKACRENFKQRTHFNRIDVITNAVDRQFFPRNSEESKKYARDIHNGELVVAILSRITERKGADLMCAIIPKICSRYPKVKFIVGGDGDHKKYLDEMVRAERLEERVSLRGEIKHTNARDFLIEGDIFLNCSRSEAFGIVLLEAACSGLYVVTTDVDGIPEVLPGYMNSLAKPEITDLFVKLCWAIENFRYLPIHPSRFYEILSPIYSWESIAEQTLRVYQKCFQYKKMKWWVYIIKFFKLGLYSGFQFTVQFFVLKMLLLMCDVIYPVESIEKALDCL